MEGPPKYSNGIVICAHLWMHVLLCTEAVSLVYEDAYVCFLSGAISVCERSISGLNTLTVTLQSPL